MLRGEVDLRAKGPDFVDKGELPRSSPSLRQAKQLNSEGSPSETVAAGWIWTPGTELAGARVEGNGQRRTDIAAATAAAGRGGRHEGQRDRDGN